MKWTVPKIWLGGDVWILGGGPSVVEQFQIPSKIIEGVKARTLSPSLYSDSMQFLHDKHVIGINVAYLIGDWIDIIFFGDAGFYGNHNKQLLRCPGIKVSCMPMAEQIPWVKYLSRDRKTLGISTNNTTVCWNQNSGSAAISLAVHLGAKRIFLLGFDMKLTDDTQHWHSEYRPLGKMNNSRRKEAGLPFNRHLQGFPTIAEDAKRLGIEIINVCPDSAIQEFPKMTLEEAMKISKK